MAWIDKQTANNFFFPDGFGLFQPLVMCVVEVPEEKFPVIQFNDVAHALWQRNKNNVTLRGETPQSQFILED